MILSGHRDIKAGKVHPIEVNHRVRKFLFERLLRCEAGINKAWALSLGVLAGLVCDVGHLRHTGSRGPIPAAATYQWGNLQHSGQQKVVPATGQRSRWNFTSGSEDHPGALQWQSRSAVAVRFRERR
jgi:hypothetical protein